MRKQGRNGAAMHFLTRNGQLLHLFGNPGMDLVWCVIDLVIDAHRRELYGEEWRHAEVS